MLFLKQFYIQSQYSWPESTLLSYMFICHSFVICFQTPKRCWRFWWKHGWSDQEFRLKWKPWTEMIIQEETTMCLECVVLFQHTSTNLLQYFYCLNNIKDRTLFDWGNFDINTPIMRVHFGEQFIALLMLVIYKVLYV
jgi:hypothetical protein